MDSGTVKTFVDAAVHLLRALAEYASLENDHRTAEDEALIRQLRVAAGGLAQAMMEVSRMVPPPMQPPTPMASTPPPHAA